MTTINKTLNADITKAIKSGAKLQSLVQSCIERACKHAVEHKDLTYVTRLAYGLPESMRPSTIRAYMSNALGHNLQAKTKDDKSKVIAWKDTNKIALADGAFAKPYYAKVDKDSDDFTIEKWEASIFAMVKKALNKGVSLDKVKKTMKRAAVMKGEKPKA